jgi:nanoRNase/pAp phosphatase (c-di-AMP/oligoRNAs hydrolase)
MCESATSTSEVLYRAFDAEKILTKELAELFLLGIIGDTGMFAFVRPSQLEIFSISQNLLNVADTSLDIFLSRYRSISDREFAIIQNLMKNTRYGSEPSWPDFQYSYIERDEIQKNNYTDEEISAGSAIYIGHYLRAVKGYSWGFVATPRKSGECRVSFRSLPKSVNVRDLAERMGIGGGHDRSAGSAIKKVDKDIESQQAIDTIIEWMKTNKPLLN